MEREEKLQILKDSPLFMFLEPEELEKVADIAKLVSYRHGDKIIQEGEMGTAMYIMVSGTVDVVKETEGGQAQKLANLANADLLFSLHQGDYFGEMAMVDAEPRSASIVARDEAVALEIEFGPLAKICKEFPEIHATIVSNFARVLCRRLRQANENAAALSLELEKIKKGDS